MKCWECDFFWNLTLGARSPGSGVLRLKGGSGSAINWWVQQGGHKTYHKTKLGTNCLESELPRKVRSKEPRNPHCNLNGIYTSLFWPWKTVWCHWHNWRIIHNVTPSVRFCDTESNAAITCHLPFTFFKYLRTIKLTLFWHFAFSCWNSLIWSYEVSSRWWKTSEDFYEWKRRCSDAMGCLVRAGQPAVEDFLGSWNGQTQEYQWTSEQEIAVGDAMDTH